MVLTPDKLWSITKAKVLSQKYAPLIESAMAQSGITDDREKAMFLAQVLHESCCLQFTTELASGKAYEGRADLGNTHPGDGVRYKGRGLIQITGRANYLRCGRALGVDLLLSPESLSGAKLAADSAAWFWKDRGLHVKAAPYNESAMIAVTRVINGGTNGLTKRLALWKLTKAAYGVQ